MEAKKVDDALADCKKCGVCNLVALLGDVGTQVLRALETTLRRLPLLGSTWRVTTQSNQVAHTALLAIREGIVDLLSLHVCACQVHVGNTTHLVLDMIAEAQRNLRCGTTSAPCEVSEQRTKLLHTSNTLLEVVLARLSLWWEVLEGEPLLALLCLLGNELADHLVLWSLRHHGWQLGSLH